MWILLIFSQKIALLSCVVNNIFFPYAVDILWAQALEIRRMLSRVSKKISVVTLLRKWELVFTDFCHSGFPSYINYIVVFFVRHVCSCSLVIFNHALLSVITTQHTSVSCGWALLTCKRKELKMCKRSICDRALVCRALVRHSTDMNLVIHVGNPCLLIWVCSPVL